MCVGGRLSWMVVGSLALMGCTLGSSDLDGWKTVKRGDQRLAAYLVDEQRPLDLRREAATNLFQMGQLGQIMGALDVLEGPDQKQLSTALALSLVTTLKGDFDSKDLARAAELAYYFLERPDRLEADAAQALTAALVDRALAWYEREDRPKTAQTPEAMLRAALLARPKVAKKIILEHMRSISPTEQFVSFARTLRGMRDSHLDAELAVLLHQFAKKRYPDLKIALAEEMIANGNQTLIRFLLDAVQDPRVPHATRDAALEAARDKLGPKAIDGLFKLLSLDEPAARNVWRLNALDLVVMLGGVDRLAAALRELPADGTWPREDGAFKADIDQFCDDQIAPRYKLAARAAFVELLDDENPIARAYALGCVLRLYSSEAELLLAPMVEDDTPLYGWLSDGSTTFGEVARTVVGE